MSTAALRNDVNRQMTLKRYPDGVPVADDFEVIEGPMPELGEGDVLCRSIYLTVDPYIRARFSEWLSAGYSERTPLGTPVPGEVIAQVAESNDPNFKPGDIVAGFGGWQDFSVIPGNTLRPVDPSLGPITTGLGALGMPGLTAYAGMMRLAELKEGETVFVSAATGGVGTVAGQIARIKGCRTVGVSSSDEKCRFAEEELGYDACLDRKAPDFAAQVKAACPDGIDVNFENAGGPVFWAALENMNVNGRMVICGLISSYNEEGPTEGPDHSMQLLREIAIRRLIVKGLFVSDHVDMRADFLRDVSGWIKSGELKHLEHVTDGIETAGAALGDMMEGRNFGKMLVRVADDPTL